MILQLPSVALPAPESGPVLRDIHLPPAPAWWPPAPGWWLLAVLVLGLLCVAVWQWRRWRRGVRERQRVLAEVVELRMRHHRDGDDTTLAAGLHQLLRRVARTHDPAAVRQQGDAWRATLARVPVDAGTLQQLLLLEQAVYRTDAPFDLPRTFTAVETWLRLALRAGKWKSGEGAHA